MSADIRQGETVIDLGSGGGLDVLLAAEKVGPEGKVIGVDMTKVRKFPNLSHFESFHIGPNATPQDMLGLAHRNVEKAGVTNASFVEASITSIPLPDSSADCIISNCVINLVPHVDKPLVFREMFRLLKPRGRIVFSDILAKKELSEKMREDVALYVGCIAGASRVHEYQKFLEDAGFQGGKYYSPKSPHKSRGYELLTFCDLPQDILIVDTKSNLNLYKEILQTDEGVASSWGGTECSIATTVVRPSCCSNPADAGAPDRPRKDLLAVDFNEWAGWFSHINYFPSLENHG